MPRPKQNIGAVTQEERAAAYRNKETSNMGATLGKLLSNICFHAVNVSLWKVEILK